MHCTVDERRINREDLVQSYSWLLATPQGLGTLGTISERGTTSEMDILSP